MDRRAFLTAFAVASGGLAGCSDSSESQSSNQNTPTEQQELSETPTETSAGADGYERERINTQVDGDDTAHTAWEGNLKMDFVRANFDREFVYDPPNEAGKVRVEPQEEVFLVCKVEFNIADFGAENPMYPNIENISLRINGTEYSPLTSYPGGDFENLTSSSSIGSHPLYDETGQKVKNSGFPEYFMFDVPEPEAAEDIVLVWDGSEHHEITPVSYYPT